MQLNFDFQSVVENLLSVSEPVLSQKLKELTNEDLPDWFLERQNVFLNSALTSHFLYLLPRIEKPQVHTTIRKAVYFDKLRQVAKELNLPVPQADKVIYEPLGLFSEQIFGPVEDYHCQCGLSEQLELDFSEEGFPRCPICGVEIAPSYLREIRIASIELPEEVRLPVYIHTAQYKKFLAELSNTAITETGEVNLPQLEFSLLKYLSKVHKLPLDQIISDDRYKALVLVMYTRNFIPVIPPSLRPANEYGDRDTINWYYIQILRALINYSTTDAFKGKSIERIYNNYLEFSSMLKKKWSHKEGFSRGKLQGKRIAWSGRAYIVPERKLPFGYIEAPLHIVLDILEPLIVRKLKEYSTVELQRYKELSKLHPTELTPQEKKELQDLAKTINTLLENEKEFVFINRQPTLHVPNIQGVFLRTYPVGKVIKLSYGWWHEINADFDGDSIVEIPVQLKDSSGKVVFEGRIEELENYVEE